jgi:type I restriction enzyme, S subunit
VQREVAQILLGRKGDGTMSKVLEKVSDRRELDMGEELSEWREVTIEDVCKTVVSGGTPLTSIKEYYLNGNIPWLKTKEVNQNKIYSTENYITQLGLDNSSAKLIPENSVTVAMYGDGKTAGRVGLTKVPLATNQACCNLIIDENIADAEFVFYCLRGSYDDLVARKTGSGQQNLSAQLIKNFEIPLPPLPEQKAIASILSRLDDKIDLLHRQNRTLEAIAETLFRQWFIEEAQENWEEGTLANYAIHQKTNVKPASKPLQEFIHYSLPAFDAEMTPVKELGSEILSSKYAVEPWVILVSKLNPQVSRVWAIGERLGENSICSMEFQVFKPKSRSLFGFLYYFLKSSDAREELSMGASGTSGSHQRVRPEDILNLRIKTSSVELAECFSEQVMPGLNRIMRNLEQIRTLEKLRDNLLPKLMSGEVQVKLSTEE